MSDASVSLGLDAQQFDTRLDQIEGKIDNFGARSSRGFGRATEASDRLLMSSHRVARGMGQFARDAVSGADASLVFASGLEHVERALRLPLGALAGLAVGGVLIAAAAKTREEYKKLSKEIQELLASPGQLGAGENSFKPFEEQLKRVREELAKLQKEQSSGGTMWGKATQYAKDFWTALSQFDSTNPDTIREARQRNIGGLSDAASDRAQKAADDYARKNAIAHYGKGIGESKDIAEALKAQEDYNEKVKKFGTPGSPDENQLMLDPLKKELEGIFADIASHIAETNRERAQGTLQEIADRAKPELVKGGDWTNRNDEYFQRNGDPSKMTAQAWWEGMQAREAQKELQLAKQARDTIGGEAGLQEAQRHIGRAAEIESQIPSLKDSEKDMSGAVRQGLDSSSILQQIKEGINKIDFGNK